MARVPRLTIADHYDAELRRHHERLRAATEIGQADRVLDVGCGAGQTTRDAGRAAMAGSVLGVDVSEHMLTRARRLTTEEGLHNVAYELGDAQVHRFQPAQFDLVISRFGTMFFADPIAAFANIGRASRRGARLVMMVWQSPERNEWATAIRHSLGVGRPSVALAGGQEPFSLADPFTVKAILNQAGFSSVGLEEVHEPVYYGPDVDTAYDVVCSMKSTADMLATLDSAAAGGALERLRTTLSEHVTSDGVLFDSRAWIVTARVPMVRGVPEVLTH